MHLSGEVLSSNVDETYASLYSLIMTVKSKTKIILFTPLRFTVEMPASDERALTSTEMVNILHHAFRSQLFGANDSIEEVEVRLNYQQRGGIQDFPIVPTNSCEVTWWKTTTGY